MEYQLVIKFWRASLADESFLVPFEAELKTLLGDAIALEGHDVNAKDINLFIATADPKQVFRRAKDILGRMGVERGLSAAYRGVGGAQFTPVWPPRPMRKFAL